MKIKINKAVVIIICVFYYMAIAVKKTAEWLFFIITNK